MSKLEYPPHPPQITNYFCSPKKGKKDFHDFISNINNEIICNAVLSKIIETIDDKNYLFAEPDAMRHLMSAVVEISFITTSTVLRLYHDWDAE